jgi:hypothetical protein
MPQRPPVVLPPPPQRPPVVQPTTPQRPPTIQPTTPQRPSVVQNNTTNITVVKNNVTNINYAPTSNGFQITNSTQVAFLPACSLDPGDVIVSVGGVSCANTAMSLQDLIDAAYSNGVLVIVVRDVNTGVLVECSLPGPDADPDAEAIAEPDPGQ